MLDELLIEEELIQNFRSEILKPMGTWILGLLLCGSITLFLGLELWRFLMTNEMITFIVILIIFIVPALFLLVVIYSLLKLTLDFVSCKVLKYHTTIQNLNTVYDKDMLLYKYYLYIDYKGKEKSSLISESKYKTLTKGQQVEVFFGKYSKIIFAVVPI